MNIIKNKQLRIVFLAVFALTVLTAGALWYFSRGNVQGVSAGWWNDNWSYRKAIVINSDYVTGDLTDFPVLISFTDAQVASHTQATGGDIVFIDSEGKKLAHEIESFATSSTGAFVGWVKVPNLSSTDDTVLNMYYGNAGIEDQQDAVNVWDENYVGVWHLNNGSNASTTDSTKNSNDGIPLGPVSTSTSIAGQALDFTASESDYVSLPLQPAIDVDSVYTISAWTKREGGQVVLSATDYNGAGDANTQFEFWGNTEFVAHGNNKITYSGISLNEWHYFMGVRNGTDAEIFVDAVSKGTASGLDTTPLTPLSFNLGKPHTDERYHEGIIDEVRLSNIARSVTWASTTYANMNSPTTFLSVQAEETGPGPVGYWTFDEGYGTTANDESGQGNDGTITGAVWQDESMCVSGKCLYFDGDGDYVDCGNDDTLLMGSGDFSLSAWFKRATTSNGIIVGKGSVNTGGKRYFLGYWNQKVYVGIDDNTTGKDCTSVATDDEWHYLVGVRDSNELKYYVDGVRVGNIFDITGYGSLDNSRSFYIGTIFDEILGDTSNNKFHGFIDEVKIYPYARSADEIRQDYAAGLAGIKSNTGVSASFGSQSDSWMSDGLVGYWNLDEPSSYSSYADSSGNGNTGTASGNASTTVGKFGNGGVFDGSGDYIDAGPNLHFGAEDFTISTWVNTSDTGSRMVICGTGKLSSADYGYNLERADDDTVQFTYYDGSSPSPTLYGGIIVNSGWHHVVVAWKADNSERVLYVDGIIEDDSASQSNTGQDSIYDFHIGMRADLNPSQAFIGKIDEVRIYNRALSPREVKKLYEWAPGPVAHWKFDELAGDTAYDSVASTTSMGGNHGTLVNSPTWTQGKYGGALDFNSGDLDNVNLYNPTKLQIPGYITLSAWIKPNLVQTVSNARIISKSNGGTGDDWTLAINENLGLDCRIDNSFDETANNVVIADKWQFVLCTYDGANVRYYVDGIEIYSYAKTGPIPTTNNVAIGRNPDASSRYYKGLIDDVRIYNYALSQKQILEVMAGGSGDGQSRQALKQPVLDLSFDTGYGDWAYDSSGFGNNGYLQHGGTGDNDATSSMWDLNGKFGKAIEFDGTDDYIDLSSNVGLANQTFGAFSISAWYKSDDTTLGGEGGVDEEIIFSMSTGGNAYIGFAPTDDEGYVGTLRFDVYDDDNDNDWTYGTTNLIDTNWHHLVGVRTGGAGSRLKVYVDGVLEGEEDDWTDGDDLTFTSGSNEIYVGDSSVPAYEPVDGLVDELKLYNYALTEDEIKTLYNSGVSAVMGSLGKSNSTATSSNAASLAYCVPGSTDYCAPPVLELKFDELTGTTTYDTSGNGNDGVFVNAASSPQWWDLGKYGSALKFDGSDDWVNAGDDSSIHLTNTKSWTMAAWININSTDSDQGNMIIRYDDNDSGDGDAPSTRNRYSLAAEEDVSGLSDLRFSYGPTDGSGSSIYSVSFLENNQWYYVVAARDVVADKEYIYINGVLDNSETDTSTGSWETTGQYLMIGRYQNIDYDYFDGLIDHVKIYNYARTPAQIAWDYNRGKPIAHWKFDECAGGTIYDQSRTCKDTGNCNNGQLYLGGSDITATGTCASSSDSFWYNGKDGKINAAGSFDGTDDYVSTNNVIIDDSSEFSISAWFNTSADGVIYSEQDISVNSVTLSLEVSSGVIAFSIHDGGGWQTVLGSEINYSEWYQAIAVFSNISGMKIYLNGQLDDENPGLTSVQTNSQNSLVGAAYCSDVICANWSNKIDEVKIYNYALTEEQVRNEYNGGAVRFGD